QPASRKTGKVPRVPTLRARSKGSSADGGRRGIRSGISLGTLSCTTGGASGQGSARPASGTLEAWVFSVTRSSRLGENSPALVGEASGNGRSAGERTQR